MRRAKIASSSVEKIKERLSCKTMRRVEIASSLVEKIKERLCCKTARRAEIATVLQFHEKNSRLS